MEKWQSILSDSITTSEELKKHLDYDFDQLSEVIRNYPMRINSYILSLIREKGAPISTQYIPSALELNNGACVADPLGEENLSRTANVVHKYPDRVLFLVTGQCAAYCRFCTRKRKVGTCRMHLSNSDISHGITYISQNPKIREVLISGGDPLLLADEILGDILSRLRRIKHVEVIRIGTRIPSSLPMRITPSLVRIFRQHHPLYINTHFNHPAELTDEACSACERLADSGIPMGCQTVLLKGINDDYKILSELFTKLLRIRVKPYYLFQGDLTTGTDHFRTPVRDGIDIMKNLYGFISGMAVPTYALDSPGGKGKIPLTPDYIVSSGKDLIYRNYLDEMCTYPERIEPF